MPPFSLLISPPLPFLPLPPSSPSLPLSFCGVLASTSPTDDGRTELSPSSFPSGTDMMLSSACALPLPAAVGGVTATASATPLTGVTLAACPPLCSLALSTLGRLALPVSDVEGCDGVPVTLPIRRDARRLDMSFVSSFAVGVRWCRLEKAAPLSFRLMPSPSLPTVFCRLSAKLTFSLTCLIVMQKPSSSRRRAESAKSAICLATARHTLGSPSCTTFSSLSAITSV
mmetsp:Transcript_11262/g.29697  ORF Transcript_11262/g.29697 Transcript_11262/m.29697 type:complete len:228 (-) Transcript_11262:707-1390(-)